jgi:hypothetical protein
MVGRGLILAASAVVPATAWADSRHVGAGTALPVRFDTTVSSATSRAEEKVLATVRENVRAEGRIVVPAGSELRGRVLWTRHPGRVKGRAALALAFHEIVIDGKPYRLSARRITVVAPDTHERDAAIIGGGAGAGALVGAIKGGGSGAAKGGAIGAAAGTGAVLVTRGKEVTIPAGSRWRVRLLKPLVVD